MKKYKFLDNNNISYRSPFVNLQEILLQINISSFKIDVVLTSALKKTTFIACPLLNILFSKI